MRTLRRMLFTALLVAGSGGGVMAQTYSSPDSIQSVQWGSPYGGRVIPLPGCPPQAQPYFIPQPGTGAPPMQGTTPGTPGTPGAPGTPGMPGTPGALPGLADQQNQQNQAPDAFSQQASAGTSGAEGGFNPTMFGDLIGVVQRVSSTVTVNGHQQRVSAIIPLYGRGAFKIAENESPRPLDRVFINYNYFNNVKSDPTGMGFAGNGQFHRETIGFEKTFLNGDASFGMRLPFLQFNGDGSIGRNGVGDLTLIGKYAWINDRQTGNVLSGGLALTVPTGVNPYANIGLTMNPVLLQPYLGGIYNASNTWYVHGFSSIVVPTDIRDVTLFFNDIGIGYWLYRADPGTDSLLTAVIPTFETHVTTPLNHRGLNNSGPIGVPDLVSLTGGSYFQFGNRSMLGTAIGVPVTGPRFYSFEALVNFNWRF